MPEHLDQAGLDLVGDDVLPAARLEVGLLPRQPDDVGQQPLGQAVLAHHALGDRPALRGERQRPAPDLDVALVAQPLDHLGDGGRGVVESFGQAGLDDDHALLAQLVNGLEVLLQRRVEPLGHGARVPPPGSAQALRRPIGGPRDRP